MQRVACVLASACWLAARAHAQEPKAQEPPSSVDASAPSAPEATKQEAAAGAATPAAPSPPEPSVEAPSGPAVPDEHAASGDTAPQTNALPAEAPPAAPSDADAQPDKADHGEAMPGDPWGDDSGGVHAGMFSFRALLQARYTQAFASSSTSTRPGYALREDMLARSGDGWSLNRFFFRVGAEPTKEIAFRAILDFAQLVSGGVAGTVKQAYATLRPLPKHVEFHAGIFKLPFSTLELDPIARYELSSLGQTDDLIKNLGFGGRDTGVDVMVAPLHKAKWLRLSAGVFRGHAHDEHASPVGAVGGRIESKPVKSLRFGIDVVGMPRSETYLRPFDTSSREILPMPDPLYPRSQHWGGGAAYSADVTFEHRKLMLRAEGMLGPRVDVDTRYGAGTFWAVWGLAAYRFRAGPVSLMPALRAEWLDTDREHSVGLRRQLTAGITCFFTKRVRLLVDLTRTDVQSGSPVLAQPLPLPPFPYFELSSTRLVGQVQVEI